MREPNLSDMKKKRYYKLTPHGDKRSCFVSESEVGDSVQSWVEGMTVGYGLDIEVVEMTEKEFESMGEYEP